MSFDGCIIKWRPVFSKVSNRWIFVNSEARESKVVFQKMVLLQETIENMTNMEIMESMEEIILTRKKKKKNTYKTILLVL